MEYMEANMVITFCGHRRVTEQENVALRLSAVFCQLFENAGEELTPLSFYCGGYGEFDYLAEKTVDEYRKKFPDVACEKVFVTPYITPSYQERNERLRKRFDDIIYPPIENVPYRYAIIWRNEWMIDSADVVIAYVNYSWGGAAHGLEYARRKEKKIIMI